jgi:hypothetical protein
VATHRPPRGGHVVPGAGELAIESLEAEAHAEGRLVLEEELAAGGDIGGASPRESHALFAEVLVLEGHIGHARAHERIVSWSESFFAPVTRTTSPGSTPSPSSSRP